MRFVRAVGVLALTAFAFTACDEDPVGVVIADLAGFWNATEFAYTDDTGDAPGFFIDAVSPTVGGEITLDVEEDGAFTGTLMVPGLTTNPQTGETATVDIGGTISILSEDRLAIDFDAATESLPGEPLADFEADFTLVNDVLSFEYATTFDFPDDLEENFVEGGARGEVDVILNARFER